MRASVINQYPDQGSTASRLAALLARFSTRNNAQFRALVAFASNAGLRLLEPGLRRFLRNGHRVFWIVGVDLGGTGREALQFLYRLRQEFRGQVDARVFSVGDNRFVFHPKVYWFDADDQKVVVVGSSNATVGGFRQNFEASLELDLEPLVDGDVLEELAFLWMSYSGPLPPLAPENLVDVDRRLIARLDHDHPPTGGRPRAPHPLHGLVPEGTRRRGGAGAARRAPRAAPGTARRQLIMDILQETRQTQVQLPVPVLSRFFGDADFVTLRQVRKGRVIKSDVRPIIHLGNDTHRIEIDAIRGLPRPQIVRFSRTGRSSAVNYEIMLKGTNEHRDLDRRLDEQGQQTREGARRWLVQ